MSPRRWLRSWLPTRPRPVARSRKPRLGIESLEDRSTPSVGFGSAAALDTGGGWMTDIAVDSAGNTYLTGSGELTKFNPDGSLAWSRGLQGSAGNDVAVDAGGNVVLAGEFSGTLTLDSVSLTSQAGSADGYVIRLDSTGTAVWGSRLGGSGWDLADHVDVDAAGNAFVTGLIDIDGARDLFVARLDATSGNTTWYRQLVDSGSFYWGEGRGGIALDNSGNVLVSGSFAGSVDFDPGPGTYTLTSGGRSVQPSEAGFVLKLSSAGNFVWADVFQASQWSHSKAGSLGVDAANNVYVMGTFDDTVDFDPSKKKLTLSTPGDADIFVAKLNSAGSLMWARSMGSNQHDGQRGDMTVDAAGNVYLTADVGALASFGSITLTDGGTAVAKLDSSGTFLWAVSIAGTSPTGIALDGSGNLTIVGIFFAVGPVDFDPTAGIYELTTAERMSFLLKLTQS
jgi:hypothetical protein